jgi:hypothetical protein
MEAIITHRIVAGLAFAALLALVPASARAQDGKDRKDKVWHLEELQRGFCVQFLVEPGMAAQQLGRGLRPLGTGDVDGLHPALRGVAERQPEFRSWVPSSLCLYYFGAVQADGQQVREKNPRKAPMLAFLTLAAADSQSGTRRDFALEVVTNTGRLERSGNVAGLDVRMARTSLGPVPATEDGAPSGEDRLQLRLGKTQLIWDGRPAEDSTPAGGALVREWRAQGRRGGWVEGKLTLSPAWSRAMIGSLKVEGKDHFARMLKASPIRFVGPEYEGGAGSLEFGR